MNQPDIFRIQHFLSKEFGLPTTEEHVEGENVIYNRGNIIVIEPKTSEAKEILRPFSNQHGKPNFEQTTDQKKLLNGCYVRIAVKLFQMCKEHKDDITITFQKNSVCFEGEHFRFYIAEMIESE